MKKRYSGIFFENQLKFGKRQVVLAVLEECGDFARSFDKRVLRGLDLLRQQPPAKQGHSEDQLNFLIEGTRSRFRSQRLHGSFKLAILIEKRCEPQSRDAHRLCGATEA